MRIEKMEIIPAIDISEGKCVRLFKGKKGTEKTYFEDPLNAIDFWINKKANRIHIVDLNGAWGSDINKELLSRMIKKASNRAELQIGGGIRSVDQALNLINLGAERIIVGTLAVTNPAKLKKLIKEINPKKIIVAIDYKDDMIATHGWTEKTNVNVFSFAKKLETLRIKYVLFSSIESDGAFTGPDIKNIRKLVNHVNLSIYAAGGIRNTSDLKELEKIGIHGVIVGKAFYEQKIPFDIFQNSKYN
ncbi:MAG: 1-(5-phosphoribosyl)-5-[(5-phosphoribosylamino)methylideneamino]imidazole-4-carboxamide isomerase [Candidatus Lokiarchaeota archaeon]|nr:1-(5-phosphoribosyl)-5-[(5-phosphoribosylamino)methylideneamino]imidazole-4-carboxamide isomerase [Candidatus Lokiarchaeota archaeon]